jgi:RNA polymerase sigma-B factor
MLGSEDDGFELVEDLSAAHSAIRALDERARQVLYLRFMAGMTQSQIAAKLGVSQMHVSRLLRRALVTLRETAAADSS